MKVVNFSHPLTHAQIRQIEAMVGRAVDEVVDVPSQFDNQESFEEQVNTLIAAVSLSPVEWQTLPILVNLPSFSPIAAVVLAKLHGIMGYFPAVLRLRPTISTPPEFEVAELLDLQKMRDQARLIR